MAALVATGVVWLALLGPLWALFANLSFHGIRQAFSAPGALSPLVVSVEAGAVTVAVLVVVG
ncbi:MAG: hypothetical protein J2P59_13090, partial [Acidimicrobiales bacterium]|nr:hypothetical protein [Acidimicrobiales bacterium]